MPQANANGVQLEYELSGPSDGEPLVLIAGLATQMTRWSETFVAALGNMGFRVLRFDNRDIGLSQKFDDAGVPDMSVIFADLAAGKTPAVPYRIADMAADVVALMDSLGIKKAHIVGTSMGGMIAQTIAADYPDHVLSLTSIMSTTGNPELPRTSPDVAAKLAAPLPAGAGAAEMLDHALGNVRAISSPGFPFDEDRQRASLIRDMQRGFDPGGLARQMAAVTLAGDRRTALARITVPTLVIHGADDPLVPIECGRDTHDAIGGSDFLIIDGMGHEIHVMIEDQIVAAINAVRLRARDLA